MHVIKDKIVITIMIIACCEQYSPFAVFYGKPQGSDGELGPADVNGS